MAVNSDHPSHDRVTQAAVELGAEGVRNPCWVEAASAGDQQLTEVFNRSDIQVYHALVSFLWDCIFRRKILTDITEYNLIYEAK